MTPTPRYPSSSGFRHEQEDYSCYDKGVAEQSPPIPADPRDRSIAGKTIVAYSRRQLEQAPICGGVDKSLLPLKKRATSHTSSRADDSIVIPPKKRCVDTESDATSAYGIPAQTHRYDTVTLCATAAPSKPSSYNAITSTVTFEEPLQQKKLMHNAIQSGGVRSTQFSHDLAACSGTMEEAETSAAEAARAKKNTNRNRNRNKSTNKRQLQKAVEEGDTLFDTTLRPGVELSQRLEKLGVTVTATDPLFLCMKTLHMSDVDKNQNRLLISCKGERLAKHPITSLLAKSKRERCYVRDCEHGLHVIAFDGHGTKFKIRLKYLFSNGAYRLVGDWNDFVKANKLCGPVGKGRRVDVVVRAFRSPMLPEQPVLEDKKKQRVVEGLEDHPRGALGLLFIPYVDGVERRIVDDAEEERECAPQVPKTKRHASAKVVRKDKKLADHARYMPAKTVALQMTLDEVADAAGREVAESAFGLLMLSSTP